MLRDQPIRNHTAESKKSKIKESFLIRPAEQHDFLAIREFLLESTHLYPEIESWWANHVQPTLPNGRRVVLVVDSGTRLEGLFIGKMGDSAKLCTLRLRESVRNRGVGRVLVSEGLRRLQVCSPSRFHVTVSEAAEEGAAALFESIGFRRIAVESSRYSKGVDEFVYACPSHEIDRAFDNELTKGLEQTLFGAMHKQMPNEHTLLMSLHPEYADPIIKGIKTVEFRRKFSKRYEGATIIFYITRPVKQFMFLATISRVDHKPKRRLWELYRDQGGISENSFDQYFLGVSFGYAIQLANVRLIPNQLVLARAQEIYPELRVPQSFQRLEPRSPLIRALDLPVNV